LLIFSPAGKLFLLCDTKVALLIFSPAGKLYEYASSRYMIPHSLYSAHWYEFVAG
jgi:hypothetical protein